MARLPTPGSDKGSWGDVLNTFLQVSHNSDGTLKSAQVKSAGGINKGVSIKTATVYADCDLLAHTSDLVDSALYNLTEQEISAAENGTLVIDGVTATAGMRIALAAYGSYGYTPESGIYEVTNAGSSTSKYKLTRASDANTDDALGRIFCTRITRGNSHTLSVVYYFPDNIEFSVGHTSLYYAIEAFAASVESLDSEATGTYAHAEGSSTASGDYSHAESSATASGNGSHAEGDSRATGIYSHAETQSTASGDFSHAEGASTAYEANMHAEGLHDAQFTRTIMQNYTADGVNKIQLSNVGTRAITLPGYFITALVNVKVVARRIDTLGTASAWTAQCVVDGDGDSSYRIVGDPSFHVVAQDAGASSWQVYDLTFNSSNHNQLEVAVKGGDGQNIFWYASIELDEIHG